MKLVVSRLAAQRVREIADYIHERNPTAARSVQMGILDAFALLAVHPATGRAIERGLRRLVMPRLPYVIYYQIDDAAGTVNIVTVRHTAQQQRD